MGMRTNKKEEGRVKVHNTVTATIMITEAGRKNICIPRLLQLQGTFPGHDSNTMIILSSPCHDCVCGCVLHISRPSHTIFS